jgi:fluoride ion exporter CrcB/FEX
VEVSVAASDLAAKVAAGGGVVGGGGSASAALLEGSSHHHSRPLFYRVRSAVRTVLGTRPDAAVRFVLRTHIAVALLAVGLWAGAAAALVLDSHTPGGRGEARRARWAAVLLAPPGCILRWRLAPLNYRLRGRLRALPAGTLAANALGCLATALLSVIAVRALPPPSPSSTTHSWARIWTRAAQAGFCGALSTVSTFMAEAAAQLRRVPADASGYAYIGMTWAVAVVITVVAYGPAVWA